MQLNTSCIYIRIAIAKYMHTCIHSYMCMHACIGTYMYLHAYIHTYIHAHTRVGNTLLSLQEYKILHANEDRVSCR